MELRVLSLTDDDFVYDKASYTVKEKQGKTFGEADLHEIHYETC
jgi:hypothetical protein